MIPPRTQWLLSIVAILLTITLALPGGLAAEKPAEGESPAPAEGADAAKKAPAYAMGTPLNGRFDLTTLLSETRVATHRYALPEVNVSLPLNARRSAHVRMTLVLEFGGETGMAEIQENEIAFQNEMVTLITRFDPRSLLSESGKLQLKEALARSINTRLRTALVRQVYITDFIAQS